MEFSAMFGLQLTTGSCNQGEQNDGLCGGMTVHSVKLSRSQVSKSNFSTDEKLINQFIHSSPLAPESLNHSHETSVTTAQGTH